MDAKKPVGKSRDHKFGDVVLRKGSKGWYIVGYAKAGHRKTLAELKKAIELTVIENMLAGMVEDGLLVKHEDES